MFFLPTNRGFPPLPLATQVARGIATGAAAHALGAACLVAAEPEAEPLFQLARRSFTASQDQLICEIWNDMVIICDNDIFLLQLSRSTMLKVMM